MPLIFFLAPNTFKKKVASKIKLYAKRQKTTKNDLAIFCCCKFRFWFLLRKKKKMKKQHLPSNNYVSPKKYTATLAAVRGSLHAHPTAELFSRNKTNVSAAGKL